MTAHHAETARAADLASCAREPIHVPGSIQPHGALLGIDENNLRIVLASANAAGVLGTERELVGLELDAILSADNARLVRASLDKDPRDVNPLPVELGDGRSGHGLIHRSHGLLILEIEPSAGDETFFSTGYRHLVRRFQKIRQASSVADVCDVSVREVAEVLGFDRVMIYRFDQHANGEVISERHADEMEPYLGLHYPASDIPAQARRLYVENPLRIIVDAGYDPVPLEPSINPHTGEPVDLTHAVLRSVSPVHCEYLKNMGVAGSLSISLVVEDRLWGLIACHHRTPRHIPFSMRLIGEFLAHILSARISELERLHALTKKTDAYRTQVRLIDNMVASSRLQDGLTGADVSLVDLIDSGGAAVCYQDEVVTVGAAPDREQIRDLCRHLLEVSPGNVFSTDCLSKTCPAAADYTDTGAGVIAVPISTEGRDFLLWFRGERIRHVTWAGNPEKSVNRAGDGRLTPRASFEAWAEEVRGSSVPWQEWEVEIASDFRTALVASVIHQAAELKRLNARLMEASEQKDHLLATVSHELRSPLNAIVGWVHVARASREIGEIERALDTIQRNANAQNNLINDLLDISRLEKGRIRLEMSPLDLREVIEDAVTAVQPGLEKRGLVMESVRAAQPLYVYGDAGRLRQVVSNLLTNSVKFSRENGRVGVFAVREGSWVRVSVSDDGCGIAADFLPKIFAPFQQGDARNRRGGLGLGLSIVKSIVELHGGEITAASDGPDRGSTFTARLPVATLTDLDLDQTRGEKLRSPLEGIAALVVDDQADAREMIAELLVNCGADVSTAADGTEALRLLDERDFDVVVSDLQMPEMDGFALLDAMRASERLSRIPSIALSAYARGSDRAKALSLGFRHHVAKPVDPGELIAVIASALGRQQ